MIVYNTNNKKIIKIWTTNINNLEDECLEQAKNLANLPFIYKWVALMPDTHSGYGMPIGGVIAAANTVIPNAAGVDIGCGMVYAHTNIPVSVLRNTTTGNGPLLQDLVSMIMRDIPTGFSHHKDPQGSNVLDIFRKEYAVVGLEHERLVDFGDTLKSEIYKGYFQMGTLGGGNHFIELQEDEEGYLGIMIHSGSRNFGYQVAKYFNDIAKLKNKTWHSSVPESADLAFLPADTLEGKSYILWMNLALEFARENRQVMMERVKNIVFNSVKKYSGFQNIEISLEVNAHHNYASLEHHYNRNVWVHRKGAIRAREGELGIIPGAMGSYSYIVKGLGNPESFQSCSHGAGRLMSRTKASELISVDKMMTDLKDQGVVLGANNTDNITDESRFAYKDIEEVINNELDLIEPIKKLKTVAVIKGSENNRRKKKKNI